MDPLQELRERRKSLIEQAEALVKAAEDEKRGLTEDESARFDELMADADKVGQDIARREKLAASKAKIEAPAERKVKPDQPTNEPGGAAPNVEILPRYKRLRGFQGPHAEQRAHRAGMWIAGQLFGDEHAQRWCQEHGVELRVMTTAVNTAGGFLVPEELSQAIIDLREEYGVFRANARVVPMASDTLMFPRRAGGLTANFVGEETEITASDKSWNQVQLVAKKLAVLSRFSSELADDAIINLADDLANEIAYAFAVKEDDCGFNGDGTSTYGGIQGVVNKLTDEALQGSFTAASNNDTFAEITAADIAGWMGRLPKYAKRNAKFYVSETGFEVMFSRLMVAGGGNTVDTLTGQVRRMFLGYPVVTSQTMTTSTGDLSETVMALFGDLALAAALGNRREIRLMVSEHRYLEFDQLAIRGTERFDINVHDIGNATTAGPIVSLIGD